MFRHISTLDVPNVFPSQILETYKIPLIKGNKSARYIWTHIQTIVSTAVLWVASRLGRMLELVTMFQIQIWIHFSFDPKGIFILLEFCKAFNILEISWKSRKYVLCEKALCHPLAKDSQNMLLNSLAWQFQNNPTFLKGRHLGTILNVIFQFFWTNRFVCWHPMIPKTGEKIVMF